MIRSLFAAGCVVLLAAALTARADDPDKPKDPPKEKLVPVGQVAGHVASVEDGALKVNAPGGQITLVLSNDVKVRQTKLPPKFDDKGDPQKYTPAELKDLKGTDTKLPGYTADISDVKPGSIVLVSASKKKRTLAEEKEAIKAGEDMRPIATMIVIEARAGE